jgi:chromate transporter
LRELARLFLKLGVTAFGGPAVHIGLMQHEVVERRRWLSREEFMDLVGAVNLIPGPNSTELTMHIGYHRAGVPGLIVAGACFIVPAVVITGALAWGYVTYGALPQVEPFLAGLKPAVLAVILGALAKLLPSACGRPATAALGVAALIGGLLGYSEILLILGLGVAGVWLCRKPVPPTATMLPPTAAPGLLLAATGGTAVAGVAAAAAPPTLLALGWVFLKIGSVLFGSGYVLFAFLEGELVHRLGWLTRAQLLDAVAAGQLTPGPMFSSATFVGWQVLGLPGAIAATIGIFLPAFVFVALSVPLVPRLRRSPRAGAFLDAVNAAALGLMGAVLLKLTAAALFPAGWGWPAWDATLIAALAIGVTLWRRLNPTWAILGGALLGPLLRLL